MTISIKTKKNITRLKINLNSVSQLSTALHHQHERHRLIAINYSMWVLRLHKVNRSRYKNTDCNLWLLYSETSTQNNAFPPENKPLSISPSSFISPNHSSVSKQSSLMLLEKKNNLFESVTTQLIKAFHRIFMRLMCEKWKAFELKLLMENKSWATR